MVNPFHVERLAGGVITFLATLVAVRLAVYLVIELPHRRWIEAQEDHLRQLEAMAKLTPEELCERTETPFGRSKK